MTTSTSKYAYPSNLNVANFVSLKLTSTNFLVGNSSPFID